MKASKQERLAIVHSDSQQAQSLARTLRNAHFYTEVIHHSDISLESIKSLLIKGIITDNPSQLKNLNLTDSTTPIFNVNDYQSSDKEIDSLIQFALVNCNMPTNWTIQNFIDTHVGNIQAQVGDEEVILAISGGVDSSVVATLLHKAIGKQLTCVFVDTGLLRYQEGDTVMETFTKNMGIKVIRIDAEDRFLNALAGEADPEKKRKIIGELFIDIFEEESQKLSSAKWLAQGTIYPDILESMATKDGKVAVKSHHNVGGLPAEMKLQLIEPLKELFKHEVREVGVALGLPKEMVYRHPFPGPGLGVRILGAIKKEYADILRLADHIFIEELRKAGLYDKTSQAFAVFIPVKSVGVSEGKRIYDYVIALRAIETIDFMTARAAHLPYELIEHTSNRIINEVKGVSRVVYDISNKPPATIEWE